MSHEYQTPRVLEVPPPVDEAIPALPLGAQRLLSMLMIWEALCQTNSDQDL